MLLYYFQMYFIFTLYVIILSICGTLQENKRVEEESFPGQEYSSLLIAGVYQDNNGVPVIARIVCNNATDFSNFFQNLNSGKNTDKNAFCEITFVAIKHLPPRALQGLDILNLIIKDPESTVHENVFEGINNLITFRVLQSSIQDIPNFSFVWDSIQNISIESSRLTSLEGKNLQNLPRVMELSFANNSINFIDPDVFKGTDSVGKLDLSHNRLTFIPPKLLDPMKNLKTFKASYNNLLHVDNLFSVTHPWHIYLDFNNITNASFLRFGMDKVKILVLSGNPIKKVLGNTFNGKIRFVEFLYLDHCGLQEFEGNDYWTKTRIKVLDLSYNLIEELTKKEIFRYYDRFDVQNLRLNGNQIKFLTEDDFAHLDPIFDLDLQENKIQWIDNYTFVSLRLSLDKLDLSLNLIKSLNESVRYMERLKFLNLSYNLLQSFAEDEFEEAGELSELYLQYNQFKVIGQLQQLPQLKFLDISHNDINSITVDQVPRTLRFLRLVDNPLKCDCSIQKFLYESNALGINTTLCLQPDHVNGPCKQPNCPGMCSCECKKYENDYFMFIDCSSRNLSMLPQFLNSVKRIEDNGTTMLDYRSSFIMDQTFFPLVHMEDHVLGINLEDNNLESLELPQLPPNLIQLYLANNKFRRFPHSVFDNLLNLKEVFLSENPWICDCNAIKFKNWLNSNTEMVKDINEIRCGISDEGSLSLTGRVIWQLTDLDMCPPMNAGFIIKVSFRVLILMLLIGLLQGF